MTVILPSAKAGQLPLGLGTNLSSGFVLAGPAPDPLDALDADVEPPPVAFSTVSSLPQPGARKTAAIKPQSRKRSMYCSVVERAGRKQRTNKIAMQDVPCQ